MPGTVRERVGAGEENCTLMFMRAAQSPRCNKQKCLILRFVADERSCRVRRKVGGARKTRGRRENVRTREKIRQAANQSEARGAEWEGHGCGGASGGGT